MLKAKRSREEKTLPEEMKNREIVRKKNAHKICHIIENNTLCKIYTIRKKE